MSINNQNTYLNIEDAHLRLRTGNVYAQGITIGGITVDPSHGLQRVSDTGNVTTTTLQFDNATTGFTTTANATVGRDLTVTGNVTVSSNLTVTGNVVVSDDLTVTENLLVSNNLTVTGNTFYTNPAAVLVDSNVVAEYTGPHDRPLRKYPEVAMTSASQDGYVVTASSEYTTGNKLGVFTYYAWKLFDEISGGFVSGETWINGSFSAYDSNGDYVLSPANNLGTGADDGEWVKLELPVKIRLERIRLISRDESRAPKEIKIYGSNDNVNWVEILSDTNSGEVQTFGIPYTDSVYIGAYKYLGLVIKKVIGTGGYFAIDDLEYYGREEGSGSLDTTLKSVYNVPATTGTQLEVYYDAKDLTAMPSTVTDLAGGDQNGTPYNVTLDSTTKSFVFNGSSSYINGSLTNWTDNQTHTISLWVKFSSLASQVTLFGLWNTASTERNYSSIEYRGNDTSSTIAWYHYANDKRFTVNIVENQWYHISAVYTGSISTEIFYLNGTPLSDFTQTGTDDTLLLGTSPSFSLGNDFSRNNYYFAGSIANFRLYSKALNADQVRELYDYQKDYFLGSKSQVTLYKGNLGVGVTEPSGQLELAGDERLQQYPPRAMTGYETLVEGHGVFSVSASSVRNSSWEGWEAFDGRIDSSSRWISADTYTGTEDAYNGTARLYSSAPPGEYVVLKLPYPIKLSSARVYGLSGSPDDNNNRQGPERGQIWGSNDGVTWEHVTNYDFGDYQQEQWNEINNINSSKYYSQYGFIVTKKLNNTFTASGPTQGDYVAVTEIQYFGTPGPTTLDKGSLSLTRSLDVPRISRYDVDTETPRPEKLVLDFDTTVNSSPTDISGKGNHGTFVNGASYSPVDKAFTFDGTTDTIEGEISGISGDYVHSISFWGNFNATNQTVFEMGSRSDNDLIGINYTTGSLKYYFYANDYVYNGATQLYAWNHFVFTYSGGGTSRKVFLNGVELGLTSSNGAAVNQSLTLANGNYSIGDIVGSGSGSGDVNGKISNFKIYSVALEPSEVKKLYNLGRTGRSMVISDTAVGIGKVPEAQLDVRGNLKVSGTVQVPTIIAHRYINGSATTVTSGNYIPFNGTIYENPPGIHNGNYFTCPVKGIYECHADMLVNNSGQYDGNHEWYVNNAAYSVIRLRGYGTQVVGDKHNQATSHYYIEANAGDTIALKGVSTVVWYGSNTYAHSHMSIRLITPT